MWQTSASPLFSLAFIQSDCSDRYLSQVYTCSYLHIALEQLIQNPLTIEFLCHSRITCSPASNLNFILWFDTSLYSNPHCSFYILCILDFSHSFMSFQSHTFIIHDPSTWSSFSDSFDLANFHRFVILDIIFKATCFYKFYSIDENFLSLLSEWLNF